MYVRPAYRRRGLARRLLSAVVEEAGSIGYERVRLLTAPAFEGAVELYEAEGFVRIPVYRDVVADNIAAFGKEL
jgi:GNAT superfamily N-acetyltransferase